MIMSSPERSGAKFTTNQEPSQNMLLYLWSQMRSRQLEREDFLSKIATCEEEIKRYSEIVKKEEPALAAAQRAVDCHIASIELLRSRTAPSSGPDNKSDTSHDQPPSEQNTISLEMQLSDSTREFEIFLGNETRRLSIAKAALQQIHSRLEEPRAHVSVREKRINYLKQFVEVLNAEIRDLAWLTRPLLRIPDKVWVLVFGFVQEGDFHTYTTEEKTSFFVPSTLGLSQVCQRWRRITHNSPLLWGEVGFLLDEDWDPHRVELLKFMLERAGDQNVFLIANMPDTSALSPLSNSLDIREIEDIRRTNLSLGVLDPPSRLNLRSICERMGFKSFDEIIIYGNTNSRQTFDPPEVPDTLKFSLLDPLFPSNLAALESMHELSLHIPLFESQIDISTYLFNGLRNLSLCGDAFDLPSDSEREFLLPELVTLRISPAQQGVLKRVTAPRLTTLVLDPPDGNDGGIDGDWLTPLLRMSSLCSVIRFDRWRRPSTNLSAPPYCSAATVCSEIVKGSQNLVTVEFIASFVDGEQLVGDLSSPTGSGLGTKPLNELVFDYCTGITRMDCDALLRIVGCLKIYV
ncbi:hypothetical protein FRC20_009280 [Serendipita sp. 405]|nr:hypothetical protein FRC20_009280 [Serendipita sp. 405]